MDWAEERYEVTSLFTVSYKVLLQSHNRSIVLVCPAETPHRSDKNGAEGSVFIHATSCVLDPL